MSDTKSGFRFVMVIAFLATAGLVAGCVDRDEHRATTTERTTTTVAPAPAYVAPAPSSSTTTTTTKQTYP